MCARIRSRPAASGDRRRPAPQRSPPAGPPARQLREQPLRVAGAPRARPPGAVRAAGRQPGTSPGRRKSGPGAAPRGSAVLLGPGSHGRRRNTPPRAAAWRPPPPCRPRLDARAGGRHRAASGGRRGLRQRPGRDLARSILNPTSRPEFGQSPPEFDQSRPELDQSPRVEFILRSVAATSRDLAGWARPALALADPGHATPPAPPHFPHAAGTAALGSALPAPPPPHSALRCRRPSSGCLAAAGRRAAAG